MLSFLKKTAAFLKRDFTIFLSYKMAIFTSGLGTIFPVLSYFFISKLVPGGFNGELERYSNDYFSFSFIGIAFTHYFALAMQELSTTTRRDQMAGCLEALLSSQTDTKSLIFMSAIFKFIHNALILAFMFVIAITFLGLDLSNMNILAFMFTFILSLLNFLALGVLAAAGTIIFKKGEPFSIIYGSISALFGGAVFPIAILPQGLQIISYIFPITYSLDALRLSLLKGYSVEMIYKQLIILLCFAVVMLPISLKFFAWAVEKGKREGTLMHY